MGLCGARHLGLAKIALIGGAAWVALSLIAASAHGQTTGVAIDVPDFSSYSFPNQVLRISTPGAAIATLLAPQFENDASAS